MRPHTAFAMLPVLLLGLTGCDPGWGYKVPGAVSIAQKGYPLPVRRGIEAHAYVNMFAGYIDIDVHLSNTLDAPLHINREQLIVRDINGNYLSNNDDPTGCHPDRVGSSVTLEKGKSYYYGCHVYAQPMIGRIWQRPNPDIKTIDVEIAGLSRENQNVPFRFRMTWTVDDKD